MTTHQFTMIATFPYLRSVLMAVLAGCLLNVAQAGVRSQESNIISIETRALGVSGETATLTVDTRMSYQFWATESGLAPSNSAATATPYFDGVTNLGKFAFNMNATKADTHSLNPNGNSGWPIGEIVNVEGKTVLCLVSLRRKDTPGLVYTARFTRDRVNWIDVSAPVQITPIDSIWERVRYQVPSTETGSARWFGNVEVTYTPQ